MKDFNAETQTSAERHYSRHRKSSLLTHRSSFLWILVGILLVAAALRLLGLTAISPPGIAHDEVANWLIDRLILSGEHALYFTRAYGHEAGYHYWQALLVALIGDHPLALRLASAYLGLMGVSITFVLARKLFGWQVGIIAMGITAVLFFPVFYSRLGLRAIMLPVFSGLAAYFWWQSWPLLPQHKLVLSAEAQKKTIVSFAIAGLLAGLSVYTYMAARAVPIFYGLLAIYLAIFHWETLKQRRRGVMLFFLAFALAAAPLSYYLLTHPGSEFRIAELDAPLRAMMAGSLQPVLANGLKILSGFGFVGDPLWRQGVAGMPIFGPILALLFYVSLPLCLWRWRDARYGFLLLWLATAIVPSLVTINAPSTIRMINLLPILGIFPAIVIHNIPQLSTVIHDISTSKAKISTVVLLLFGIMYACWTAWSMFVVWPPGGDVPFVWQTALRDIGKAINDKQNGSSVSIGGWSPDTMDPATMQLYLNQDDIAVNTFGLEPGDDIIHTLVIPNTEGIHDAFIFHPLALPLDPTLITFLENWQAERTTADTYTQYSIRNLPPIAPPNPAKTVFGHQLQFLGYTVVEDDLITYWRAVTRSNQPMRLFVHVLDETGEIIAEDYNWDTDDPQNLWQPHWQEGAIIIQKHQLPTGLADAYQLRLGIFDPYSCTPAPCHNLQTDSGKPFLLLPLPE